MYQIIPDLKMPTVYIPHAKAGMSKSNMNFGISIPFPVCLWNNGMKCEL